MKRFVEPKVRPSDRKGRNHISCLLFLTSLFYFYFLSGAYIVSFYAVEFAELGHGGVIAFSDFRQCISASDGDALCRAASFSALRCFLTAA